MRGHHDIVVGGTGIILGDERERRSVMKNEDRVRVNLAHGTTGIRTVLLARVPAVGEWIWPDVRNGPLYVVQRVTHFVLDIDAPYPQVDAELQVIRVEPSR